MLRRGFLIQVVPDNAKTLILSQQRRQFFWRVQHFTDVITEWIIPVGHRPKSKQNGSMAAHTAPTSDILAA